MNSTTKITKFENSFIEISDVDTFLTIKIKPGAGRHEIEESLALARYIRSLLEELNDHEYKRNDRPTK